MQWLLDEGERKRSKLFDYSNSAISEEPSQLQSLPGWPRPWASPLWTLSPLHHRNPPRGTFPSKLCTSQSLRQSLLSREHDPIYITIIRVLLKNANNWPWSQACRINIEGRRLESALLKITPENYFPHSSDTSNDSCNYIDYIQNWRVEGGGEVLRELKKKPLAGSPVKVIYVKIDDVYKWTQWVIDKLLAEIKILNLQTWNGGLLSILWAKLAYVKTVLYLTPLVPEMSPGSHFPSSVSFGNCEPEWPNGHCWAESNQPLQPLLDPEPDIIKVDM